MEIASRDIDRKEVLAILGEFTEMPLSVKLEHLSRLMYGEESEEERKAEFQKLLSSLPVESVRAKIFKKILSVGLHCTPLLGGWSLAIKVIVSLL